MAVILQSAKGSLKEFRTEEVLIMKVTKKPKRKTLYLTVVALVGILLAVGVSFAAYTNQAHLRGTVRNGDSQSVRFTSNYLQACMNNTQEENYAGRKVLFSEDSKKDGVTLSIDIEVYNYINGENGVNEDAASVSEKDIEYTMTIQLAGGGADSSYDVKEATGTVPSRENNTYTFSGQKLIGRKPNSHKYTVTFPGTDVDSLRIIATAVPTNLSVTNNQKLAIVITPCVASNTAVFSCIGNFTDADSGNAPSGYAAYNYEVSISSGRASVTVKWDADAVEIDPFFLKKLESRGSDYNISGTEQYSYDKAKGTITFIMDQTTGTGDYLIPFYSVNRNKIGNNWPNISVSGEELG